MFLKLSPHCPQRGGTQSEAEHLLFGHCVRRVSTAGVRPLSLATQHFHSFVFRVIPKHLSPRFGSCTAGVRSIHLISLLVSPRFSACTAGVRPFPLATQHFYSFVSQVIFPQTGYCQSSQCFQRVSVLCGTASLCLPCSLLSLFCFPSCFPFCWSLCPPYLPSCLPCFKNGLGNASLLSHLFGVYGGVT